jgi:hypothetical protein
MDAFGVARARCLLVAHEVIEAGLTGTLQHHLAAELRGSGMRDLRLAGGASDASTAIIPYDS